MIIYDIYIYVYNVNPGLINPKRLLNWGGTIYVSDCDYLEGTPTIDKQWFINPELTLQNRVMT